MGEGKISRRTFCKGLAVAALFPAATAAAAKLPDHRQLQLHNIHTDENLDFPYNTRGRYDRATVRAINRFFRCHYTGKIVEMDLSVVDLLFDIRRTAGANTRIQIISGYRSPEYNEFLRRQGHGVAKNSLHTQGLAIDFAVPGQATRRLAAVAQSFSLGGVGTYPDFVHIDSGRVRHWVG
jgi:uncharacterized protein YcbK (DUF882 family)